MDKYKLALNLANNHLTHLDDQHVCDVCGEKMIARQAIDPDCVDGVSAVKTLQKIHACRSIGQDWHKQLAALIKKARNTPSARLSQIYSEEAELIRQNRVTTKITWKDKENW